MFQNSTLLLDSVSLNTVKPVYIDHPGDPKIVAVVGRGSLFIGSFMLKKLKMGHQNSGH